MFENLIKHLSIKLNEELPGKEFHRKMAAMTPLRGEAPPKANARKSAVLLLLYPNKDQILIPYIQRPAYDGVHGGQMSLPGGKVELEDESLIRTALREAQEEIGIKAIDVQILGRLTEIYIAPSNYFVLPVVGYLNYIPEFYPDSKEVDSILNISIDELLDKKNAKVSTITNKFATFETASFVIQEKVIWGATALMTAEFLELVKSKKPD